MTTSGYYVYAHAKPDATIFYVGKGTKRRAWSMHGRSTHWARTVAKYGHLVVILVDGLSEFQAVEEEAACIAHFKRFGTLVNVLDRGDVSPTSNAEVAAKVSTSASAWQKGRTLTEQHRRNIAKNNAWLGKKRPAHAAAMKGRFVGEKNSMFGQGARQRGSKNHAAVPLIGRHLERGVLRFCTGVAAAQFLGVSPQAVAQALRKQQRSKGWLFERAA